MEARRRKEFSVTCLEIAHTEGMSLLQYALVSLLTIFTGQSCCPDVLSAMHLPADFLVHYGHACLTPYVIAILFRHIVDPTQIVLSYVHQDGFSARAIRLSETLIRRQSRR